MRVCGAGVGEEFGGEENGKGKRRKGRGVRDVDYDEY